MAVQFTVRFEDALMEKIDAFANSKDMNRSEAIKHLVDLGLKLNNIRENAEDDLTEDRDKILIEVWLIVNGLSAMLKKVNSESLSIDYFTDVSKYMKEKFEQKFISMSEAYKNRAN